MCQPKLLTHPSRLAYRASQALVDLAGKDDCLAHKPQQFIDHRGRHPQHRCRGHHGFGWCWCARVRGVSNGRRRRLRILDRNPLAVDPVGTIEHLLQHRSGIPDYEPLVPTDAPEQVRDADVLQLMIEADTGYFPSGSAYRYSNSGYAVLAMIVAMAA